MITISLKFLEGFFSFWVVFARYGGQYTDRYITNTIYAYEANMQVFMGIVVGFLGLCVLIAPYLLKNDSNL